MLTSAPLSSRATERGAQELLLELYKLYFTGVPHDTLIGPATYPVCNLLFNQSTIAPPTDSTPQIHTVFAGMNPRESWWKPGLKLIECRGAQITIFVRATNIGETDNRPEFVCRSVADNVKEIFQSENRCQLAQKGFRNVKLRSGPNPMATSGFQTRILTVTADLRYFSPRSDNLVPTNA